MKPEKLAEHTKAAALWLSEVVVSPSDCQYVLMNMLDKKEVTFRRNCLFWGTSTIYFHGQNLLWERYRQYFDEVPYGQIIDKVRNFAVLDYGKKSPIWQQSAVKNQLRRIKSEIIRCSRLSQESESNQKVIRKLFERDAKDYLEAEARNNLRRLIQEYGKHLTEEMIATMWRESVVWGVIKELVVPPSKHCWRCR